jgi:hypothetical protein
MNKFLLVCGLMAAATLSHAQTKTPPDLTRFITKLKTALTKKDGNFVVANLADKILITLDPAKAISIPKTNFARAWNLPSNSFLYPEMLFAFESKNGEITKNPTGYQFSAKRPFNKSEKHVLGRRMLMRGAPHKWTHSVVGVAKIHGEWKITGFVVWGGPS